MDDQIFDKSAIVEYYDEDRFKLIAPNLLMDFIIARNGEKAFLDTWCDHFKSVRVPYAVTKHVDQYSDRKVNRFVLWKQRRI